MSDKEKAIDVLERVTLAVHFLCIGEGDVRSRVGDVVIDQFLPLKEGNFPADLQAKYRAIIQAATMPRISRSTAAEITRDIWDLYAALRQIAELH